MIYDGTGGLTVGGSFTNLQFRAGEQVVATANYPVNNIAPTQIWMEIDGVIVDTAPFPGTVSYTFQNDGTYDVASYGNGQNVTWSRTCSFVGLNNPSAGSNNSNIQETDQQPQQIFFDGRINDYDTGNPVVLYPINTEDGVRLDIYNADQTGLLVSAPVERIATTDPCPNENTLILNDLANDILFYRLSNCQYYLRAPMNEAGKYYILIFDDLISNTNYESRTEFIIP
ncbi:MAG: hypothetical protein AAFX46_15510 [Cyanobacteria bacterium J06636_27]